MTYATDTEIELRRYALTCANQFDKPADEIVRRAEEFLKFLRGEKGEPDETELRMAA